MATGFALFLASKPIARSYERVLSDAMGCQADRHDTHPPLAERIAIISKFETNGARPDAPGAITLVKAVPALERQLLMTMFVPDRIEQLRPIDWAHVEESVWVPEWERCTRAQAAALDGMTLDHLPDVARELETFSRRLAGLPDDAAEESRIGHAKQVLGAALALAFRGRGDADQLAVGPQGSTSCPSRPYHATLNCRDPMVPGQ